MSTTIDQNVVQMKFDNVEFERNIQTSMNSVAQLRDSINQSGGAGLASSVGTIASRFSTLGVISTRVLTRITDSAITAGKNLLKSLTITPVKTGLEEYELKMNSIQTILMGAKKKNGARVTIDEVKEGLEELNKYADQTIYNFQHMTENIGKFTNAGVDWETSVDAIQGVANAAALAGANSSAASRAMYNFSQALAVGYMNRLDWRSIENANMATLDFKEELLKTAIACGTVEKGADGMYKALSTDNSGKSMKDATKAAGMFTEGLRYQWLTSDVLTQTLARYSDTTTEIGKKATEAATRVKTFTQLLGVLRESAQSGWAMTFEHILGDFNEAKEMWTNVKNEIDGIIQSQADSRNDLLKGWKKEGGRTALLNAVKNSWFAFKKVATDVGSAFRDVFPAMTAERLANITKRLESFTKHLKLSDENTENLKSTFRGIFATLDLLKQGFSAIVTVISPFTKYIDLFISNFLKITGALGDFIFAIDKADNKIEAFKEQINNILGLFSGDQGTFVDRFKNMFSGGGEEAEKSGKKVQCFSDKFKNFISKFGIDIDTVKKKFEDFMNLFGGKGKSFNPFEQFFKFLDPVKEKFSSAFGDLIKIAKSGNYAELAKHFMSNMKPLFDAILKAGKRLSGDLLDHLDIFKILKAKWDIKNAALMSGMLKSITSFFDIMSGNGKKLKSSDLSKSISLTLGTLRKTLTSFQKEINARTLVKIATAVGILAGSIILLSGLNADEIGNALMGIGGSLTMLVLAFKAMNGFDVGSMSKSLNSNVKAMRRIAVAVFVLSVALQEIAKIPADRLQDSFLALSGIMASLVGYALLLNQYGGKNTSAATKGMLTITASVLLLTKAVKKLGQLNPEELGNGLLGVGSLLVELGAFFTLADFNSISLDKCAAILVLAAAMRVLSGAVKQLATIDPNQIGQGLFAMAALFTEIGLFMHIAKDASLMMSLGASLVLIAFSVKILADSVKKLSDVPMESLGSGLFAIGALLTELGLFTTLVGKDTKGLTSVAMAMPMIANGLKSLTKSLTALGGLDPTQLSQGLVAIGTLLTMVGLFSAFTSNVGKMTTTATALTVMAFGIKILIGALNEFATANPEQLGSALVMLGGSLGILVIALNAMQGTVAGALALLVVAGALRLLAPALMALSSIDIGGVMSSLMMLAGTMAVLFVAAIAAQALAIPLLILAGVLTLLGIGMTVFSAGLMLFGTAVTTVFAGLIHVITPVIEAIQEFHDKMNNMASGMIEAGASIAASLGVVLLNALGDALSKIPGIGDAMGKALHGAADKLSNSIDTEKPKQKAKQMKEGAEKEVQGMDKKFGEEGKKSSDALADNMNPGKAEKKAKEMKKKAETGVKGLYTTYQQEAKKASDAYSDNLSTDSIAKTTKKVQKSTKIKTDTSQNKSEGKKSTEAYASGMKSGESKVKSTSKGIAKKGVEGVKSQHSSFRSSGVSSARGLAEGLNSMMGALRAKGRALANAVNSSYRASLQVHSPSRVMDWNGRMTVLGLINALERSIGKVSAASSKIGSAVKNTIKAQLDSMTNSIDTDFEYEPMIRPVMDLNNVNAGIESINSSLSLNRTLSLSPEINAQTGALTGIVSRLQNGAKNSDVVSAIGKLREEISNIQPNVTHNNINGVTYDDGSNIVDAVETLVRAVTVEGRA